MPGICQSVMTTSGVSAWKRRHASSPSSAIVQRWPSCSTAALTTRRVVGSSSAMRTCIRHVYRTTRSMRAAIGRSLGRVMTDSVPHRLLRGLSAPAAAAFAVVILLISGTFGALLVSVRGFDEGADSARRADRVLNHSSSAERDVVDVETGLRGYLLTGETRFLEPFEAGRLHYRVDLAQMDMLVGDPGHRARLRRLRSATDAYGESYPGPLRERGLPASRAAVVAATSDGKRRLDAVRARFKAFNGAEEDLAAERSAGAESHGSRS